MHNFGVQKQRAINQLNEMQKRATPPKEKPIPDKTHNAAPHQNNQMASPHLPFNDDSLIILGLILILQSENCDMLLILALAYILM